MRERIDEASAGLAAMVDAKLVWLVIFLMAFSVVMVFSASVALPDSPKYANYSQFHFVVRHAISIVTGAVLALLVFQVPIAVWQRLSVPIFMLALLALVLVLVPFIGKGVNGARRWIPLGVVNFQPSEFVKVAAILYASGYMVRRMEVRERFFRAVLPMLAAVMVVGGLLLLEPDMGAFIVISATALGILFLGGVNATMFFSISAGLVSILAIMIASSPWRRERFLAYLDPWDMGHALDKGYQLSHSLIAFGRGQFFGVGLGASVEKLHWLPEAHTDFILAIIGEELGLLGVVVLILAMLWMIRRIILIGRDAVAMDQIFAGLVAQGVGLWIGVQSLINMGVNLGALPTKGLTLPFMSYGGSAIMMNLVAVALVLRVDYENRVRARGGREAYRRTPAW